MKRTNQLFKSIIAIAAATIFMACKKEIDRPQNGFNASHKVMPLAQVVNPLSMTKPKTPIIYVGNGTLGDSTSQGKVKVTDLYIELMTVAQPIHLLL